MRLKDYSKEELEAMSYDDIAIMILTESNKQMKINDLFKKVCDLIGLSEDEYIDKLPAFFDVISTDHRFIMLENGMWDLKTKHSTKVIIDSDEEDDEDFETIDDLEEIEESDESEKEDIYADNDEDDLDSDDDDLKDLVIIDEEDEANGLS